MTYLEFLKKIESKEKFSEFELMYIWYGNFILDVEDMEVVESEIGEYRRWNHMESKVWRINDRFFRCYADIANTEMQEDEFWMQPQEVFKQTRIVEITEYIPIEEMEF